MIYIYTLVSVCVQGALSHLKVYMYCNILTYSNKTFLGNTNKKSNSGIAYPNGPQNKNMTTVTVTRERIDKPQYINMLSLSF